MISARFPLVTVVALAAIAAATLVTAHSHHHHHHHHGHHRGWLWVDDGKQSQSEALANCLCWNTTSDKWCHHPLDGHHTGFWRDSCARVVAYNTWWWIHPVLLWCIYLVVMPLCMAAFRLCCNCCGGRTPSFGVCCPISNSVVSPDPTFERKYSRCATNFAKIAAICAMVAFINVSIHSFIRNSDVHTNVENYSSTLSSAAETLIQQADGVVAMVNTIGVENPKWMNQATRTVITEKAKSIVPSLRTAVKDINKSPKDDFRGRVQWTRASVAVPLVMFVVITFLGIFNVRSWPISISAGILSFITLILLLVASVTMTAAVTTQLACDNSQTITTLTKQMMSSWDYCNNTQLASSVNNTQIALAEEVCKELSAAKMLPKDDCFCTGSCRFTVRNADGTVAPAGTRATWKLATYTTINTEYLVDTVLTRGQNSVAACALSANCATQNQATAILTKVGQVFGPAPAGSVSLFHVMKMNQNCHIVDSVMQETILPQLCTDYTIPGAKSLSRNLMSLASLLFVLCFIATAAFWIWMNGSKRFTRGVRSADLRAEYEANQSCPNAQFYPGAGYTNMHVVEAQEGHSEQYQFQKQSAPLPVSPAVAATAQEPLLLSHQSPTYTVNQSGELQNGQVIA